MLMFTQTKSTPVRGDTRKKRWLIAFALLLAIITACSCSGIANGSGSSSTKSTSAQASIASSNTNASNSTSSSVSSKSARQVASPPFDIARVPVYSGKPAVEINDNTPYFSESDLARGAFETYSALDSLGRCGPAFALVGPETMPHEERGSIGAIRPSGWHTSTYDWVDGRYLYNRCHLIAFALASENDNELNLITGTRSMNVLGMLPLEEQVASYIDRTRNHVLYRVTPMFEGDNLVASGVLMEAQSIEDSGAGIRACIWCYNVEPGVAIDYATGDNWADGSKTDAASGLEAPREGPSTSADTSESEGATAQHAAEGDVRTYVLNTNTGRFHYPDCKSVLDMSDKNKQVVEATRDDIIHEGYQPCGVCKP